MNRRRPASPAWVPKAGRAIGPWVLIGLILLFVGRSGNHVYLNVATLTLIWAIWGGSMNLVWGYCGDFTMAQVGLGGFGAYLEAVLVSHYNWAFWPAFVLAVVLTVAVGVAIGVVAARLTGFYYSIMTLAFTLLLVAVVPTLSITGRNFGIQTNVNPGTLSLGFVHWNLGSRQGGYMLACGVAFLVATLAIGGAVRTRWGQGMVATREDPILARSVGVETERTRLGSFALGALLAGIAGVLYGGYLNFILPTFFSFDTLITLIVLVVLGGRGFLFGPLIGAAIYVSLTDWLRFGGHYSTATFGLILIAMILFAPRGILGLAENGVGWWRGRKHHSAQSAGLADRIWFNSIPALNGRAPSDQGQSAKAGDGR